MRYFVGWIDSLCPVAFAASLSEPKVMLCVLCKASLLFPEGSFALDESYRIAESFKLIIVSAVFTTNFFEWREVEDAATSLSRVIHKLEERAPIWRQVCSDRR